MAETRARKIRCPHCGVSLKPEANQKHIAKCSTASPADRAHYFEHRAWPSPRKAAPCAP